jgi:hypothetical protein
LVLRRQLEAGLKKAEEVMEILEAYDLAGTLRGAAVLAGCDHKTVAHWVAVREQAGGTPMAQRRRPAVGDFARKIDELVERSGGRIRAPRRDTHQSTRRLGRARICRTSPTTSSSVNALADDGCSLSRGLALHGAASKHRRRPRRSRRRAPDDRHHQYDNEEIHTPRTGSAENVPTGDATVKSPLDAGVQDAAPVVRRIGPRSSGTFWDA